MAVNKDDVADILYQQLRLLAEESEKAVDVNIKIRIAGEIDRISSTILTSFSD